MFRIATEQEFVDAFRRIDRKHVQVPAGMTFPLVALDYRTWADVHGQRVFLLFKAPGQQQVTGVVFRRTPSTRGDPPGMCEWCHTFGGRDQVGMLTTDVSSRKRVGVYLCLDLKCRDRVEDDASRRGQSALEAVKALLGRMAHFSEQALGIRQTNRNQPAP